MRFFADVCRLVIVGGLVTCAPHAMAQRGDTIYENLTNTTGGSGAFISAPVTNIGQTGHTLFVTLSGCSNPTITNGFEFSFDNAAWQIFGYGPPTNITNTYYLISATGAFPFVRAFFSYTPTTCTPTVLYTGVVANPYTETQGLLNTGAGVSLLGPTYTPNPVISGSLGGFDGNTLGLTGVVAPTVQGGTIANVSVTASSTTRLNTSSVSGVGVRVYVSQLVLTGSAGSTGITLLEGKGGSCGTSATTIGNWIVNVGSVVNLGPFRLNNLGDDICIAAATGNVTGTIVYGALASSSVGW